MTKFSILMLMKFLDIVLIFHQEIRIQHRIFFKNMGREDQFSKSFWVRSGDQDLI